MSKSPLKSVSSPKLVEYGRILSKILRHTAPDHGLEIDPAGWVSVNVLVEKVPKLREVDLGQVVAEDEKGRFLMEPRDDGMYIRANQGHSISSVIDEHLLTPITDPGQIPDAIHGTYTDTLSFIMETGLCRMRRNNIHFATKRTTKAGIRQNAQVFIYLDIEKVLGDGIKLYISKNNVVLSPGIGENGCIPLEYFLKIETV